ncbi:hypothetical protein METBISCDRAFT_24080 [Metschnikowia bicuspidata]|uniref:Trafficking protein particle complex subunit 11 domain-containing protein n=1 Tax=Metschnikowia bicuspidata TaxID=27322 RepID=A0A4P9ZA04_9ASCO|nr:hypothetical protein METBISCDRAFT_24080 [Metschnikowia bicuspidata]
MPEPNANAIAIEYYDPFGLFPTVHHELEPCFPIKRLHWRYDPAQPVKLIQELPVAFREEYPKRNALPAADRVYLRLMFVKADTVDEYRSQARPLVSEWLRTLVANRDAAWGIIFVGAGAGTDKRPNIGKKPFDKLQTDFAGGKQLRALELTETCIPAVARNIVRVLRRYDDEATRKTAYRGLFITLKELLCTGLTRAYVLLRAAAQVALSAGISLGSASAKASGATSATFTTGSTSATATFTSFATTLRLVDSWADLRFFGVAGRHLDALLHQVTAWCATHPPTPGADPLRLHLDLQAPLHTLYDPDAFLVPLKREPGPLPLLAVRFGLFLKRTRLLDGLARESVHEGSTVEYQAQLLHSVVQFANFALRDASIEVKEWLYAVVDHYLGTVEHQKIVAQRHDREASGVIKAAIAQIVECWADLHLVKRRVLSALAADAGYAPLDAIYALLDMSLEQKPPHRVSYAPLKDALVSEDAFFAQYDALTTRAIREYVASGRCDTADLLSIDSAMLFYRQGNYAQAHGILGAAYARFIATGWSMMGGVILETYLKCARALEQTDTPQLLPLYFQLFKLLREPLPAPLAPHQSYPSHQLHPPSLPHSYRSIHGPGDCDALFAEMHALAASLDDVYEHALLDVLDVQISPGITFNDASEAVMTVTVVNALPISFTARSVAVVLANTADDTCTISFAAENVTIGRASSTTTHLTSRVVSVGDHTVRSIVFVLADQLNLVYREEPQALPHADELVLDAHTRERASHPLYASDAPLFAAMLFALYPHPEHFHIELQNPAHVDIHQPSVDCVLRNGPDAVHNLSVAVVEACDDYGAGDTAEEQTVAHMVPKTRHTLTFRVPGDRRTVVLRARCVYESQGGQFEFCAMQTLDLCLNVSVVVNDFFRAQKVYSRFLISAVDASTPLRISGCEFTCAGGSYTVRSLHDAFSEGASVDVTDEQPLSVFYELTRAATALDAPVPAPDPASNFTPACANSPAQYPAQPRAGACFNFRLTYISLAAECHAAICAALREKLGATKLHHHYHLLASAVGSLTFCWPTYLLSGAIVATNLAEVNRHTNERLAQVLLRTDYAALADTLRGVLALDVKPAVSCEPQQLYIAVDVPELDMLHEISFEYTRKGRYAVGEPIETQLVVRSTGRWRAAVAQPGEEPGLDSREDPKGPPVDVFLVHVIEDDNWLITGMQTTRFRVNGGNGETRLLLCLLPVVLGDLALPKISVTSDKPELAMDTVVQNSLEAVLVVPQLDTITFTF